MDPSSEIAYEWLPLIRIYKDGHAERFKPDQFTPPGNDHDTGVSSKDAVISSDSGVTVRIYLPPNTKPSQKLPIIVSYHGGGFTVGSAFGPLYHCFQNRLSFAATAIVVSVEYRLAPEHPIPTLFADSWAALCWIADQVNDGGDPWLSEHGDLDKVFLTGESAGGTIAHNTAMCASGASPFDSGIDRTVRVEGLILVHPFFLGSPPKVDELWEVLDPAVTSMENPLINIASARGPSVSKLGCRRVLVFAAGKDHIKDRAYGYKEILCGSGWEGAAEMVEHPEGNHCFHCFDLEHEDSKDVVKRIAQFVNRES